MSNTEKRQELLLVGTKLRQVENVLAQVPDNYTYVREILEPLARGLDERRLELRKEVFG